MTIETFDPKKQLVNLTISAQKHFRDYMKTEGGIGIRLGVKKMGCSGMAYVTEVIKEIPKNHQQIEFDEINLYVDEKAIGYLNGLMIDYVKRDLGLSQIIYNNPNETARCGCGESFSIAPENADTEEK